MRDTQLDEVGVLDGLAGTGAHFLLLQALAAVRDDAAVARMQRDLPVHVVPVIKTLPGRVEQLDAGVTRAVGAEVSVRLGQRSGELGWRLAAAVQGDQRARVRRVGAADAGMGDGPFARGHEGRVVDLCPGKKQHAVLQDRQSQQGDDGADHGEFDHRRAALGLVPHAGHRCGRSFQPWMPQVVARADVQGRDGAGGQFQRVRRARRTPAEAAEAGAPRAQAGHAAGDDAVPVEVDHVDGIAHAGRMHAGAARDQQALRAMQRGGQHQAAQARDKRVGQAQVQRVCAAGRVQDAGGGYRHGALLIGPTA